jgi:NADH-quinone oxidoreductase subunit J
METFIFFAFGILAVISAIMVITQKNPVYSAMSLLFAFFCIAGLFALLSAHFIAIVHIAVYAGAIMVLFLFVIMLLNLKKDEPDPNWLRKQKYLAFLIGGIIFVEIVYFLRKTGAQETSELEGTAEIVGKELFTKFLFPFEIASILLLVAMIGAIFLTKKKLD